MRRLRVTILDLVTKGPTKRLYGRVMNPNLASIMPQVVAVWCEQAGHDVRYICYTGTEDLERELLDETDLLFIGAFTRSALTAYAISALFRRRGAVTVLGGPHARSYSGDAARFFDYVLGFTTREILQEVLRDCTPSSAQGRFLTANQQPAHLPGVKERWKFIEATLAKAPTIKIVPMIASLGCPYTCNFCIDADVDYQTISFDQVTEDLRFLLTKMRRPRVGWHDPNFGVRFDSCMTAIEEAIGHDRIDFIAEMTLSLLSEPHLKRMKQNGFKAVLPGIESWYAMGDKSKTGRHNGLDKVKQVSEHVNLILRYIPYVQTNFVLGLDTDQGPEPFELTKRFLDWSPGAFPTFNMFTAFGRAVPLNEGLQREGRILPFPFPFLDSKKCMNVYPKFYRWPEFYDHLIDLTRHAFSWPLIARRFQATRGVLPRCMNFLRAVSSAGFGRLQYHSGIRRLLDVDRDVRRFFEQETEVIPSYYTSRIRKDLGVLWEALPPGALSHEPACEVGPPGPIPVEPRATRA